MVSETDELDRRLTWEKGGELAEVSTQAMAALLTKINNLFTWLRKAGEERPFISILFAFQTGYALARLGRRRAKH